ncbi:acyl-CoA dehydrogenase family protein [Nocardiopsis sp. L17-MgMaSL7]|uniref:acyl-CoA dehydrogenase family protein n=1 Tax=Nocardiopsis sp. L17-MgMaSL7 TaxID=1938893 RepID=UPI000D71B829|nr:acyl-CoA dehydrogenase family protein [Nocardiopsis sp. L17-MgMaSL7]PWV58095.1 alkylation response protein AidB-like acyl-CoA dehydrogenase [Nocardiopsis sp. L17-MgMaSL7]
MIVHRDRAALEALLPGLDAELTKRSLSDLESTENDGLSLYRRFGGCGLLIPKENGGLAADAHTAIRAIRALAGRSPSLAVAATMHNFSVASLVALATHSNGFEWMLLDAVASDRLLVCSAFAEGRSGQGVLAPTMRARRENDHWVIDGRKKPCSLSRSMNLITASVALEDADGGEPQFGVALIPAETPGISVRPFWNSQVLTGAESDELILDNVIVGDDLVVRPELDPGSNLDNLQTTGMIWFSLLIAGGYLGMAGALVERLWDSGRDRDRCATALLELEAADLALASVASELDSGAADNGVLARALTARYAAHDTSRRVADSCVEALGGMGFVSSRDVSYLVSATHAGQFHPPSRRSALTSFHDYFDGSALRID